MQLATRTDGVTPLPDAWITRLLGRLQAMYGDKFTRLWEGVEPDELANVWAEELAGFGGDEIALGLIACRSRDWPPTSPEFGRLCRPWMAPEVAHQDAVAGMAARQRGEKGNWPHPAIYWAATIMGAHDLLNCGYAVIRLRWERLLAEQFARGSWEPVPEPTRALPAPGQTVAAPEEVREAISRVQSGAALSMTGRDERRWAKKILAEQARKGGQRYSLTVVEMARKALGIEEGDGK